jgi:hypothetical protein
LWAATVDTEGPPVTGHSLQVGCASGPSAPLRPLRLRGRHGPHGWVPLAGQTRDPGHAMHARYGTGTARQGTAGSSRVPSVCLRPRTVGPLLPPVVRIRPISAPQLLMLMLLLLLLSVAVVSVLSSTHCEPRAHQLCHRNEGAGDTTRIGRVMSTTRNSQHKG